MHHGAMRCCKGVFHLPSGESDESHQFQFRAEQGEVHVVVVHQDGVQLSAGLAVLAQQAAQLSADIHGRFGDEDAQVGIGPTLLGEDGLPRTAAAHFMRGPDGDGTGAGGVGLVQHGVHRRNDTAVTAAHLLKGIYVKQSPLRLQGG